MKQRCKSGWPSLIRSKNVPDEALSFLQASLEALKLSPTVTDEKSRVPPGRIAEASLAQTTRFGGMAQQTILKVLQPRD